MSTSSSDDEPVGLASEILGKFAHSEFPPGWKEMYMPEGGLDELITRRSIIREFYGDENRKDVDESLIKFIRHSAKKVFAISLISNVESAKLRKAMKAFNASGFTDNKLPVDADDTIFPGPRLKWTAVQKKNFQDNQWRFLVPVFRENEVRLALGNRHILPFKLVGRERREGTFSDVWQVVIDKLHQETPMLMLNNGKRATAAIKVLKVAANQSESEAHHQWDNEARALEDTKGLRHSHIIEAKAIILWEGKGQYFMFQWADGGSLRDLYVSRPKVALDAGLVKEIVHQLSGLAGALNKLHNWKRHSSDDGSYRHGDLKPENILRFCDNTEIGVLKISDLGLAKHHVQATADRGPTITRYGTALYEPPEAILNTEAARSRQYDIWSMGCVVLELLIWLLYGYKELEGFNESMRKALGASSPYWVLDDTNIAARSATVHPSVVKCMNIMGKDPECVGTTAIGDLLTIVRTRLLVIPLPRDSPTFYQKHGPSPIGYRAKAEELERALKEIVDKGESNSRYWVTRRSRSGLTGPVKSIPRPDLQPAHFSMNVPILRRQAALQGGLHPSPSRQGDLNDIWELSVSNNFVDHLVRNKGESQAISKTLGTATLCSRCEGMEIWSQPFSIEETLAELKQHSKICDFCLMRWNICIQLHFQPLSYIRFDRLGSCIRVNERYPPVFSVSQEPAPDGRPPIPHLQMGFAELPEAGCQTHLEILRHWLTECDERHPNCEAAGHFSMPTRLIDVGSRTQLSIKLYETKPGDNMRYLALSHPWGQPPHFCTFMNNVETFKLNIEFRDLPATFQNAVTITRELEVQYLWIDSICIIQGPDGDFSRQAHRMEDVFSQAYCVLAASSAKGQEDGFLHARKKRHRIRLQSSNKPAVCVSDFIDNFDEYVLQSPLNQRGWVLQERALARRTIYFTAEQTFWECGNGVQCETMTKMNNTLASFLGDPAFPKVAIESSRGGKIRLYQDLYKRYSRLGLSHQQDRPIAIAGLEKRLIQSFPGVHGGFGVLDDDSPGLLRRSLLWCRGSDVDSLEKIDFQGSVPRHLEHRVPPPPTWSWMAYRGGIEYLNLPFDQVKWEENDILSPWSSSPAGTWYSSDSGGAITGLSVIAREFEHEAVTKSNSALFLDIPGDSGGLRPEVNCVILGRMKSQKVPEHERLHYVMLVSPWTSQVSRRGLTYKRVGIGYMPGHLIHDEPAILARVH